MADIESTSIPSGSRQFDAIGMEIFSNRMLSITESMAGDMMRSSFSAQIKERRDFSVGIFDPQGRLIAQGTHIPLHLGSLLGSVEAVLQRYKVEDMIEGDAFICNDPYLAGGTHLPDISVITPVFVEGVVVAFVANIGHHTDIGGTVPGSISAQSHSIFEEGIRIPVIKIARAGQIDEDLLNLLATNSRLPDERRLDLKVQIAVNVRGGDMTRALFVRMGVGKAQTAIEDVFSYTSERLRRRVAALAAGSHTFRTWLDDDGTGGDPVPIVATVTVGGNALHIDLEGTGPQSAGALNVPASALRATIYYCVKALLDPDLMANSGMFSAVTISAPEGSIANPKYPAACGVRSTTCQKIAGAVFGAFRELLPVDRQVAGSHNLLPALGFAGTRPDGSYYVVGETLGGGSGARNDGDGMDAIHVHVTNSLNMPTEALEASYPLICEEYALVEDSGGAGRHRGGLGIARQVRTIHEGTVIHVVADAYLHGADGIAGGGTGGLCTMVRNPGRDDQEKLPTKIGELALRAGDSVRLETPGGGGFGPADERPINDIGRDLRDGIISVANAERDYGVDRTRAALAESRANSRPKAA